MRSGAILLAVLLAGAVGSAADDTASPVTVTTRTDPASELTIGQRFRYLVTIRTPPDVEIEFHQPTERLGDFDIVDFGELPVEKTPAGTTVTRWFTLVGWSPGYHLVKSPSVRYRQPGGEPSDAPSDEMGIKLESLLDSEPAATDIHDVPGIAPVPFDRRPLLVVAGALALIILVAAAAYLLRHRRGGAMRAAPPRPAHEIAAEALATLHRRNLVERGEVKEYYSALSAIVRTYLEGRYGVHAPEMTTEEFLLSAARDGRLAPAHRSLLSGFLTESDLVKFARLVPTLADAERAMAAARRFVAESAPAPEELRAAG